MPRKKKVPVEEVFDEEAKRILEVPETTPKKTRKKRESKVSEERAEELKQIRLENLRKGRAKAIENRQKKALIKKLEADKKETEIETKLKEKYSNKKEVEDLKKQIEELNNTIELNNKFSSSTKAQAINPNPAPAQAEPPAPAPESEPAKLHIKKEVSFEIEEPRQSKTEVDLFLEDNKKALKYNHLGQEIEDTKRKKVQKPKILTIDSIPVASPQMLEKARKKAQRYKISPNGCSFYGV